MTKARRGLNMLLRNYPEAEVMTVWNQDEEIVKSYRVNPEVQARQRIVDVLITPGPWTCVDLLTEPNTIEKFAIWNETGYVYRIQGPGEEYPGAVEEDPFLKIRDGDSRRP